MLHIPRPLWRYYLWHAGLPLLLAALVFALFEFTSLDLRINDLFFDPVTRQFPLRNDWFLETIMHRWAKYLLLVVALIVLAGFAASFFRPGWRPQRRRMLFVFLAMVLGSGMVGLLKQTTNRHCPYDLDIYGGYAPYKKLLEPAASGIRPGECWPGGHASGGFGLMAFYFLWRRSRPRLAWAGLVTGLAYGSALGAGRMIQGAHFLPHNLWSALLLYELLLRHDEQPVAHP